MFKCIYFKAYPTFDVIPVEKLNQVSYQCS